MTAIAHAPTRSLDQRMASLRRANDVRMRRAALKRSINREEVARQIRMPEWYVETMKAHNLVKLLPGMGPVKTRKLLTQLGISDAKTVGGLSSRQRHVLIEAIS